MSLILNPTVFVESPKGHPTAHHVSYERVSQDAWTLACNASYQNTWWPLTDMQDDILSIIEEGNTVCITFGRFDGSFYQESYTL